MRNLKLTIAYDGTEFHGWQAQRELRTVEDVLAASLCDLVGHEVALAGASRTDQGVHALGQAASFKTTSPIPVRRFAMALNGRLPEDLKVREAEEVGLDFHARFNALGKHYRYLLHCRELGSVFLSRYALTWTSALDIAAMRRAATGLVGEHDFASFQSKIAGGSSVTVRTLHAVRIEEEGAFLKMDFWGGGFLYKMVRTLAGTLLDVGRGKRSAGGVEEVLLARDRRRAGPTLPPHGLCLVGVYYDELLYKQSRGREWPILSILSGEV